MSGGDAHFRGFGPSAPRVLGALAAENTRETFHALKPDYEREVRDPAMDLVADLNAAFAARDVPLHGDPKRALFRPNRDVRFARDKSPYKTNVSFIMTRSGDKHDAGLFYFQLGHDVAFAALGFYVLEPADLTAMHERIVARPNDWRAVVEALAGADIALSQDSLAKRLPRGLPSDAPADLHEALRLKSFTVSIPLTAADVADPRLANRLAEFAHGGLPLSNSDGAPSLGDASSAPIAELGAGAESGPSFGAGRDLAAHVDEAHRPEQAARKQG